MKKRLVTSALPYVNNVPHLGNLIQMLSADVFARFCRLREYETLYICGTDEYGTATETRALSEKISAKELCDRYFKIHKEVYEWFEIDFDKFGRTSNEQCTQITQEIFKDLEKNDYIIEKTSEQLFCKKCNRFLADRYVRGICPKCGAEDARGDQCETCGSLLEPEELKSPKCLVCSETPELRKTKHLYIDLPKIAPKLKEWMEITAKRGKWSANAIQMTKAWIRDGLSQRAITRDLKWGIPVPREGYENKVFYVWFNAPIGYISITKQLAEELAKDGKKSFDWKSWWLPEESQNPKAEIELFQFIGKDNIPFHTVIFPSSLLGTQKNWTKLFHMSATEFLNYESGKFSKSKGVGVFGSDAKISGIPADAWRFYIFYIRPEKQDAQFSWMDFREKYNGELTGNLGNLVNRTILFANKYYESKIPDACDDEEFWQTIRALEAQITENLEWANLKNAFHQIFEISDFCNKYFQKAEPWKTRTTAPEIAAKTIKNLCYAIKDLSILISPFLPAYAQKVASFFEKSICEKGEKTENLLNWSDLGKTSGLSCVKNAEIFFKTMEEKIVLNFRKKFSGENTQNQKSKENSGEKKSESPKLAKNQAEFFTQKIDLRVAKIIKIENNPSGEKLFVETLDDGSGTPRIVQSGLRPYLAAEDLLGKHIILAANLAPRKMRGIESHGMLLAADYKDENGKDCVEVLQAPWAAPGTPVTIEGFSDENFLAPKNEITIDDFFAVQIRVKDFSVLLEEKKLLADGKPLTTQKTKNGAVS